MTGLEHLSCRNDDYLCNDNAFGVWNWAALDFHWHMEVENILSLATLFDFPAFLHVLTSLF